MRNRKPDGENMTPDQTVRNGEVELAVYTFGEARDRPTLVLVHGYPDSANVWKATAERLAEKYFVVAYDVRGAGRSTRPKRIAEFGLDYLVADLAAVVDALVPDSPIHLIGHDWGSMQSWEAVTTARMRGRIASFTSISGPCLDHAGWWLRRRLKSRSLADLSLAARQFSRSWYMLMFQLPMLAPIAWRLGLAGRQLAAIQKAEGTPAVASESRVQDGSVGVNLYRANILKRLLNPKERRTEIPVQLIVPLRDGFIVKDMLDELPHWTPRLWRREIDAGHWVQLSHPDLVAAWVSEFVDFIESGEEPAALREARCLSSA